MLRETHNKQTKPLLSLGSVNERVQGTELQDNEWSSITGTFPDFTGEQARVWGKRTLGKYNFPIMGIYQFWTPLGYAGGIYQFSGSTDFGKWLTPVTKLDLTIPSTTNFDGGGISLDDFGQEFNRTADVSTPNVCSFSFSEFQATHQYCGTTIKGSNLPDDSNGGPAGQGKHCKWQNTQHTYSLLAYYTAQQHGTGVSNTSAPATYPPFAPNPIPLGPIPTLVYGAAAPPQAHPFAQLQMDSGGIFAPPTQFFDATYENYITYIDLTPVASVFVGKVGTATITVTTTVNSSSPQTQEIPISLDFDDPDSYSNLVIDASQYLPSQVITHPGNPVGSHAATLVQITALNIYVRAKVCQ